MTRTVRTRQSASERGAGWRKGEDKACEAEKRARFLSQNRVRGQRHREPESGSETDISSETGISSDEGTHSAPVTQGVLHLSGAHAMHKKLHQCIRRRDEKTLALQKEVAASKASRAFVS